MARTDHPDKSETSMTLTRLLAASALILAAQSVQAVVVTSSITFEDDYSGTGTPIDKNYGSIVGALDTLLEDTSGNRLRFWSDAYSGAPAAYSDTSVGSITLTPLGGRTVTLNTFFLGGWPNSDRNISYAIDDLATDGVDFSSPNAFVPGSGGTTVVSFLTSASGIKITFGPDGFNGGINYINYTLSAPVPEPETWAMLGLGLGLLGFGVRRARR